jgi:hypothetical protein
VDESSKTAIKTAKPSPRSGVALPLGAHPGNTGGKKGRSGRPPNWLKDFCDDMLADPKCQSAVRTILRNPDHSAFATMWKAAGDRAHGKPDQKVDINVNVVEQFLLQRHAARNGNGASN